MVALPLRYVSRGGWGCNLDLVVEKVKAAKGAERYKIMRALLVEVNGGGDEGADCFLETGILAIGERIKVGVQVGRCVDVEG
jgi:hypothetical protein